LRGAKLDRSRMRNVKFDESQIDNNTTITESCLHQEITALSKAKFYDTAYRNQHQTEFSWCKD
jgi:hypothetical protein